jgi:hypothetical protein
MLKENESVAIATRRKNESAENQINTTAQERVNVVETVTTTENQIQNDTRAWEKKMKYLKLSALSDELNKANYNDEININRLLISFYLDSLPRGAELQSFFTWKERGFSIKKGSEGFMVWGRPRVKGDFKKLADDDTENKEKYFPISYLFSSEQVEKKEEQKVETV